MKNIFLLFVLLSALIVKAQDTTLYNDTFKLYFKGKMLNGKKEGRWISYDIVNNMRYEGFYKNDLQEGHWKFYYNKYLTEEGNFKKGKRCGLWRNYYLSGHEIEIGKYKNGIKSGKWLWYQNDELGLYEFSRSKLKRKTKLTRIVRYKHGEIVHNDKIS
jgi:antitoxin component YwqK of YwqJK toxin-antitoxin module